MDQKFPMLSSKRVKMLINVFDRVRRIGELEDREIGWSKRPFLLLRIMDFLFSLNYELFFFFKVIVYSHLIK